MKINISLASYVFALSILSLWVVLKGAEDEPYMGFRMSDAIVQVGVGITLIAYWIQLVLVLVVVLVKRVLQPWWLLILPWVAIVVFYLSESPIGYVEDIAKYVGSVP